MRIYSWNMLYRNRELDRAFGFIATSNFDIFCLQEVPEEFLERLKTLPCFIASRTDTEIFSGNYAQRVFIVILSKHKIVVEGEIPFPDYWSLLPTRSHIFIYLMWPFYRFYGKRSRTGLYADLTIHGQLTRVFNLHLALEQSSWRLREFEIAMAERDASRPTIVCGDFNILEKPHARILNWFLGENTQKVFPFHRERTYIEKRFAAHELANPLFGKSTHPVLRSQLDHILVSHSFTIKNAEVIRDRHGSDHHPIRVEVA